MKITHSDPVAGAPLDIQVQLDQGWAEVAIELRDVALATQQFDCPDPPCHERFSIDIPLDAIGETLVIHGRGPSGHIRLNLSVEEGLTL